MLLRKDTECRPENIVWFPVESGIFIFSTLSVPALWSHPEFYAMGTDTKGSVVNRTERESDR